MPAKPSSKSKTSKQPTPPSAIYVLADTSDAELQKFGGAKEIPIDTLKNHLQSFTAGLSSALSSCQTIAGQFELSEIEVQATLSAEFGFVLVTKAGVEGSVSLKFVKH